jgi:HlyD family secretion protein
MLKFFVKAFIVLAIVGTVGGFSYGPAMHYWRERNKPKWETAKVTRGDAFQMVNSTGTVRPVLSVSVGSFVSGPIVDLNVDFNDEVKAGFVMAKIDPRLFEANVARDKASLATREADVIRVTAQLQQARNNKLRGEKLREKNEDFLSDRDMDALRFDCEALEAQLEVSKASVLQSLAVLENSLANLEYTEIKAPVDGVVIDRKIDPGQTLAAQFQTPELFIVAPDLEKKVHVFATVDETDIGLIFKAQKEKRPVTFTVQAYPEELFSGEIEQIRVSSSDLQNVVTYPVIVAASNAERKLLPGMTATISFEVDSQTDVIKIPYSAIRFYPQDIKYVRPEDHHLLDGSRWKSTTEIENEGESTAAEKTEAQREKNRRHVWVQDGGLLKAVEVVIGLEASKYVVMVSGDLKEGDELVTALEK